MAKDKIIATYHPFELNHPMIVYKDGNKIDGITFLDPQTFISKLDELSHKYSVYHTMLSGPPSYLEGLMAMYKEKEITKYEKNEMTFEIL